MTTSETYTPTKKVINLVNAQSGASMIIPTFLCLLDHSLIWLPAIVLTWAVLEGFLIALAILPITFVLSARSMRGLECLVHDASHYNWSRKYRRINDLWANIIAANVVLSSVQNYRATHTLHHNAFSSEKDPDFQRHKELDFDSFDRSTLGALVSGVNQRFWIYFFSWWEAIGSNQITLLKFIIWHSFFVGLFWVLSENIALVLTSWILGFLLPFLLVLPVLRMIGEASEHDYESTPKPNSATYTNIGFWQELLFHPHNDGLHTLHHAFPHVPHFKLGKLNRALHAEEASQWKAYVRVRSGLFSNN